MAAILLDLGVQQGDRVRLEAANPRYAPLELPADQVTIQGRLVGVWRDAGRVW